MTKTWARIDIECASEIADDLGAELADLYETSIEFTAGGIRVYVDGALFGDAARAALQRLLDAWSGPERRDGSIPWTVAFVPDEDWAETWKAHFKPLRVGRHFLICPTWEQAHPGPGDRLIRIDPGMAFGTGHHETTRLCLEWLEDYARKTPDIAARSLFDVGTGSGILAIAGALLGFGQICGVDNDPEAIGVARENLDLNGLSDRIRIIGGSVEDAAGTFDVVIANIQSLPLIRMAAALARKLPKGGGTIALSGILIEQAPDVAAAFEAAGLEPRRQLTAGEWRLIEIESPGKDELDGR
jgi:ribosomal protein L11 methyltransferase